MKILHIDIETSPNKVYTWGLFKQNISLNQIIEPGGMICYAAKRQGKKKVTFRSEHHHGRADMLDTLWELLDEADVVCHYNGKSFDMKHINREFLLDDYLPTSPYRQIDLLTAVKGNFRFLSNKLDFVSQQLEIGKKVEHSGFQLWVDCEKGDTKAWAKMKQYNIQDTMLLEDLYNTLRPWIRNHPNVAMYQDVGDDPTCRTCGSTDLSKNGVEHSNTATYQRYKCKDCGSNLQSRKRVSPTGDGVLK